VRGQRRPHSFGVPTAGSRVLQSQHLGS
jgi:hypothetical protein